MFADLILRSSKKVRLSGVTLAKSPSRDNRLSVSLPTPSPPFIQNLQMDLHSKIWALRSI